VAATVRVAHGRALPAVPPEEAAPPPPAKPKRATASAPSAPPAPAARKLPGPPDRIEPGRHRRIARDREPIELRLDLHGLDQDRARAVLEGFLRRAWDEGYRAVLVITGKGLQGDGILRRRTPEWLAAPHLAQIVAGISEAHRRHGGEGALYVALKRKPRA
jgi:DNA-nicking Smr family endonuclease